MRQVYSLTKEDFLWSDSGDFVIQNGDIKDTRNIRGLGFSEEVSRRIQSSFGDWKRSPEDGANLHVYKGKINNAITWEEISSSISLSLTKNGFLNAADFKVTISPISHNEIAGRIDFSKQITDYIDVKVSSVKFLYNLEGQGPFIMR